MEGIIFRERVSRRIESAAICPVVLLVASGGFGKSVALDHFLAMATTQSVRYVVSAADRTLHAFARGLLAVLPIDDASRDATEEALAASGRSAGELAQILARNLADFSGIAAVDDFHYAATEGTSEFLAALVEATVPRVRWVIASRSTRELPVAEWIATGICAAPITSDELAFTVEEASTIVGALTGLYPKSDVQKILALRGFPLAFFLAVRFASTGAAATKVIAQARELTYDYLARQVYHLLTADEQRHLQFGALLRGFECELFEQAGFSSARRVLQRLYRHGSFLVASDRPEFYFCNDVFLDFLLDQLRMCPLEEQRVLRMMAADVLMARGREIEAMLLYAEAQDYSTLLVLLDRRGFELISDGQQELVREFLKGIPREMRDANAMAIALEALLIGHEERYAQAEPLFVRAMELSANAQERLSISFQFALYQKLTKVADAGRRFTEIARTADVNPTLRVSALGNALLAHTWLDPFYDVEDDLDEIDPLIASCERDVDRTEAILDAGIAAMYAGDDRALEFLARAEEAAKRKGHLEQLCSVYQRFSLFALYCDGDVIGARQFADRRRQVEQQLHGTRVRRGGLVLNMLIALRAGEAEQARVLLAEHAKLPVTDDDSVSATINRVRAMLSAWSGDYERTYKLMRPILSFVFPFYRPIAQALCALAGAAAGIEVVDLIEEQVRVLRASSPRFARSLEREHTARALLAIAASVSGKHSLAKRLLGSWRGEASRAPLLLREVAQLLRDQRDVQPFAAVGMLEELSRLGCNDLRLFLAPLFQQAENVSDQPVLTDAEAAVLRLLAQGLKPKEIAELRDTSIHTTRKQLQNLRAKLHSNSTDQLLARAHALELLERKA